MHFYRHKFFQLSCFFLMTVVSPLFIYADTTPIDHVVAVANDDVILSSQLEERSQIIYRQISQQRQNVPPLAAIKIQVLERLILESLQLQLAERASIKLSNDELQSALASIARQNNIDINQLKINIEAEGISFESFRKNIETEILLQRIQQGAVSKRVDISEQDITNFLNSEEGKIRSSDGYRVSHIVLNYAPDADDTEKDKTRQLASNIVIQLRSGDSFEKLAQEYSSAADASVGGDLGWRTIRDIPSFYVDAVLALSQGDVSDPLISNEGIYILKLVEKKGKNAQWVEQTRARHILVKPSIIRNDQEAMELLTDLRNRILAGESFTELAAKFSEDYGSALKGGDLGWTTPGQLVPQFQQVMDSSAIDAVSYPFQSPYGWHILQVQERRNQNLTDELIRQSVRSYLTKQKFETELPLWLQELRAEAYVVIKDPTLIPPSQ